MGEKRPEWKAQASPEIPEWREWKHLPTGTVSLVLTGQFWSIYGETAWGRDTSLNTKLVCQHLVRIDGNSVSCFQCSCVLCLTVTNQSHKVKCELFHTRRDIPSPKRQCLIFKLGMLNLNLEASVLSKPSYYTEIRGNSLISSRTQYLKIRRRLSHCSSDKTPLCVPCLTVL